MKINNKNAKITNQVNIENNYAPINLGNLTQKENTETPNIDKVQLRNMIGDNKLKEVLHLLAKTFPNRNDFTLQKGRLSGLESKNRIGVLSSSEYTIERNKITAAILEMIDEL